MIESLAMITGKEWAVWIPVGSLALIGIAGLAAYTLFYKEAPKGKALVRIGLLRSKANITGLVSLPVLHHLQVVSLNETVVKVGQMQIAIRPKDNDLSAVAIAQMQRKLGGESQLWKEIERQAEAKNEAANTPNDLLAELGNAFPAFRFSLVEQHRNPHDSY